MFYEDDRIRRKNNVFVNSRAYELIQSLELKCLNDLEIKKYLNALAKDTSSTETQIAVVKFALSVIKKREISDEKPITHNDDIVVQPITSKNSAVVSRCF